MPKISLGNMLLLVAIVALLIVLIVNKNQWQKDFAELQEVRKALNQLEDIAGRLKVSDPVRAHAVPIQTIQPLTWAWQIYIPEPPYKRRHRLVLSASEIQDDGSIRWVSNNAFQAPGRFILKASITKNADGELILTTRSQGQTHFIELVENKWEFAGENGIDSEMTTAVLDGESVALLRLVRKNYGLEIRIVDEGKP